MGEFDLYPVVTSADGADTVLFRDVSDNGVVAAGKNKQITVANLGAAAVPAVAGAYADQLPAREYGLPGSAPLTGLLAAVANRNNARVDIPVIGDSVTFGRGASAFGSTWVQQANRAIRAAYPTVANGSAGGLGFIPAASTDSMSTFTWPVAISGTLGTTYTILDMSAVRAGVWMTGTTSLTWTAPAGTTSARVGYYDGTLAGSFTYRRGSGATTTVTPAGSEKNILTASIPITAGEVLTIAWASGNVIVDGIIHFAGDESSGITFHGCGRSGWCAGTEPGNGWSVAETYALNWAQAYAHGFPSVPPVIAILLGANDSTVGAGNRTAAEFASDMVALIALIRGSDSALAAVPMVLICEYSAGLARTDPGGWPAYVAALRGVAAADTVGARVIDLDYRFPFLAYTPLQYTDFVHPSDLGHALIGEIIAAGLRIA